MEVPEGLSLFLLRPWSITALLAVGPRKPRQVCDGARCSCGWRAIREEAGRGGVSPGHLLSG